MCTITLKVLLYPARPPSPDHDVLSAVSTAQRYCIVDTCLTYNIMYICIQTMIRLTQIACADFNTHAHMWFYTTCEAKLCV